ncbi:MAG: fused MFS/spermidine synthase [Lentisphaerae bacterium]|nr:fused MFS/spermidine synthase [Lentisphaerota bacterium]
MKIKLLILAHLLIFCLSLFCHAEDKVAEKKPQGESFWESFYNFFLPHAEKRNVLFEKQTQYFLVTVEEDSKGWRHMVFNPNKGSQGIWNLTSPDELISNYCRFTAIFLPAIDHPPKRALFIGLGAGIVPRFLRKQFPETIIDIVEIDGDIPGIAENYFGFETDEKMNISIGDGRDFINRTKEKYDIVFIDAYSATNIPFQLTTAEFYRKVRDSLSPSGIMTANIANLGKPKFISSELKTVMDVFPNLVVFVCVNRSNYILFAPVNRKLDNSELKAKSLKIEVEKNLDLKMCDMIDTRMAEDELRKMTEGMELLKDDFAPVETME